MERIPSLAFADQLRAAREAALKDAEAFDEIIHSIERLGSFLTQKCSGLGDYGDELEKIALASAIAEEVPRLCPGALTPFSRLDDLVQNARNDARTLATHRLHSATDAGKFVFILARP